MTPPQNSEKTTAPLIPDGNPSSGKALADLPNLKRATLQSPIYHLTPSDTASLQQDLAESLKYLQARLTLQRKAPEK